ncbi:MAG: AraC family transcriptional regulator [Lachnospiraceae bacterium]|nr:AraC family transcriptional regulator [Lachnospiraceae bacterium]
MDYNYELIIPNSDLPFKMFLFEEPDGNYYRNKHWHRSIEIFAILEGGLIFQINDKKYPLGKNDFIIVNSNEIHGIDAPIPNHTIVIQIPLKTFENYYTGDQFIRFTHVAMNEDRQLTHVIHKMYQAYEEKKLGYELQVQSDFYALLHLMVTTYRERDASADMIKLSKRLNRLAIITGYIKENYKSDLSLENLAEIFGYSPTYLSRMFQKYANINYKSYLQSIRLEYGYRELLETDISISQIAMNHGFPNNKAFSRAFLGKYGVLPSRYRKEKRQESAIV